MKEKPRAAVQHSMESSTVCRSAQEKATHLSEEILAKERGPQEVVFGAHPEVKVGHRRIGGVGEGGRHLHVRVVLPHRVLEADRDGLAIDADRARRHDDTVPTCHRGGVPRGMNPE